MGENAFITFKKKFTSAPEENLLATIETVRKK
jgi:hypothetical protein